MTQFSPPLSPSFGHRPSPQTVRYSAAAIAGFCFSLIGCLFVPAILGLLFGVIGIFTTSQGKRRGRGLAIAAIPISLLMGVLSLGVAAAAGLMFSTGVMVESSSGLFSMDQATSLESAEKAIGHFSDDFRAEVTSSSLSVWAMQVVAKHGALNELALRRGDQPSNSVDDDGVFRLRIALDGKFVNRDVPVTLTLTKKSLWKFELDDFDVDGHSPRDVETPAVPPIPAASEPTKVDGP